MGDHPWGLLIVLIFGALVIPVRFSAVPAYFFLARGW
jgi:hypothetical protein